MWNQTRLCRLIAQQPPVFPGGSDRAKPTPAEPGLAHRASKQQPTYRPSEFVPSPERPAVGPQLPRQLPAPPAGTPQADKPRPHPGQSDRADCGADNAALLTARTPTPFTSAGYRPIAPCRREARVGGPARGRALGRLGRTLAVMEPAGRMTADRTGPCAADPAGGLQPIRTPAPLTRTRVSPARSVTVSSPGRPSSSPWCNVRTASSATRPNSRA